MMMELTETKRQNAKCAWNAVAQAKQSFIKILDPDEIIAPHVQQAPTAPGAPLTDAEWKELMRNVSNLNRSCRPELDAVLAKRNTAHPAESLVDHCAKVAEQDSAMPDWKKGSAINERPIASVAQADWDDQHKGTRPAPVDGDYRGRDRKGGAMKVNGVEIAERWVGRYNAACSFTSCVAKDLKQLIEELSQAETLVRKLAVKPEDVPARCSYCGAEICRAKDWDAKVPNHMAACEKNPLTKLLKRYTKLGAELAKEQK